MSNICLDTCAFFAMIKYNETFNKNGMDALDDMLKEDEEKIKAFEQSIKSLMSADFLKEYSQYSFSEQLELYKDYATSKMALAEQKVDTYEKNAQGIFFDNGNEFRMQITDAKRASLLKKAQIFKNLHDNISATFENFKQLKEDYKLLVNNHQMGLVYRNALEGKYDFFITPTVYAEILNHEDDNDSKSEKGNIKFEQRKIDALFEKCTFLSMATQEIREQVDKISEDFRTKGDSPAKEMAPDINSLGIYGDSMIMAEASLAGMNLITLNRKDFIYDNSIKQNNDFIRQHIAFVEKGSPFTTDALPYSPAELLEGKTTEPSIKPYYKIPLQTFYQKVQDYDGNIAE